MSVAFVPDTFYRSLFKCVGFLLLGESLKRYSVQGNDRMRVNVSRWTRYTVLGLVASSFVTTGCSGWKMPSMKMPWSKKPSASALAGTGPSSLAYPASPATKQMPSALASTPTGKAPAASTSASPAATGLAQLGAPKAPPPAYSPTSPANAPSGYKLPVTGIAAAANGYATGPYNTSGQAGAPGSFAAGAPAHPIAPGVNPASSAPGIASGYAATNPYAPPAGSTGMPSAQAYGGGIASTPYGGRTSAAPAMSAASIPTAAATMGQFAAAVQPPASNIGAPQAPVGFAASNPALALPANSMTLPTTGGAYSPVSSSPPSAAPNGYAQSTPNASGYSMPNTQAAFSGMAPQIPTQTAAYSVPSSSGQYSSASYRPGSTSRTTGYNFAPQGTSQVAGAPATASVPYTAGGSSNPSYSLPSTSTLNR